MKTEVMSDTNVFKYPDTNSSRAGIEFLNRKFENQKIAIIGLGGTGSYILDQVAKTPVKEIHIFDDDVFQLHNAFRSPGAVSSEKLEAEGGMKKVDYYHEVYSNMHTGIKAHPKYVTIENVNELKDFSYVFISIDKNEVRYNLVKEFLNIGVTFIDVGIGVNKANDCLNGAARVTVGSSYKNDHLDFRIGSVESEENEYSNNIQIADLNCLNAMLAVLKWKKLSGFYQDIKQEHNSLFLINTNKLLNEDNPA
ncbi:MAG: ThiF family adenylyltransferase [Flavobacteriaceae bacterium]|nr:ThiF family adenylyltransferase [Flavobacteriaceae bacterium]